MQREDTHIRGEWKNHTCKEMRLTHERREIPRGKGSQPTGQPFVLEPASLERLSKDFYGNDSRTPPWEPPTENPNRLKRMPSPWVKCP